MVKKISKIFLTGLLAILPLVVTGYVIFWLTVTAETTLGGLIRQGITNDYYVSGMGIVTGLVLIFLLGLIVQTWIARRLLEVLEALLNKIPVVNWIYGGLRDLTDFFARTGNDEKRFHRVVMVPLGDTGMEVMGFLTAGNSQPLPEAVADSDKAAVYLPMSYQVGGYTVIIHRDRLREVDMPVRKALQFSFTAGMTGRANKKEDKP